MRATIGRLTRYTTVLTDDDLEVDLASRTILIGSTSRKRHSDSLR